MAGVGSSDGLMGGEKEWGEARTNEISRILSAARRTSPLLELLGTSITKIFKRNRVWRRQWILKLISTFFLLEFTLIWGQHFLCFIFIFVWSLFCIVPNSESHTKNCYRDLSFTKTSQTLQSLKIFYILLTYTSSAENTTVVLNI